jgi:hypothetical protein
MTIVRRRVLGAIDAVAMVVMNTHARAMRPGCRSPRLRRQRGKQEAGNERAKHARHDAGV